MSPASPWWLGTYLLLEYGDSAVMVLLALQSLASFPTDEGLGSRERLALLPCGFPEECGMDELEARRGRYCRNLGES